MITIPDLEANFHKDSLTTTVSATHQDHDLLVLLWDKGSTPINCNAPRELIKEYPLGNAKFELIDRIQ
jgi:anti-sigma regulatory factor (Ser/Thr protein kinase)